MNRIHVASVLLVSVFLQSCNSKGEGNTLSQTAQGEAVQPKVKADNGIEWILNVKAVQADTVLIKINKVGRGCGAGTVWGVTNCQSGPTEGSTESSWTCDVLNDPSTSAAPPTAAGQSAQSQPAAGGNPTQSTFSEEAFVRCFEIQGGQFVVPETLPAESTERKFIVGDSATPASVVSCLEIESCWNVTNRNGQRLVSAETVQVQEGGNTIQQKLVTIKPCVTIVVDNFMGPDARDLSDIYMESRIDNNCRPSPSP